MKITLGGLLVSLCLGCGGAAGGPRELRAPRAQSDVTPPPLDGQIDDELTVQLAELMLNERADEHAVPLLQRALVKQPDDARVHYLYGTLLRDRGIYAQAEASLRRAISLDPKMAPAQAGLGLLYDLKRNHAEAQRWHAAAIALDPEVARFRNNLGFSLYLAGKNTEAVVAYESALKIDPAAARVYVNLGFAYAAMGQTADAERAFRQTGDEAAALNNLALAHELKGQPEKARLLYNKALGLDPRQRAAAANLEALDEGNQPQIDPTPKGATP